MAKAKFISSFELDIIRIGVARGHNAPLIAKFLRRNKLTIYNHIEQMKQDETLDVLPFDFIVDEIAAAIGGCKRK